MSDLISTILGLINLLHTVWLVATVVFIIDYYPDRELDTAVEYVVDFEEIVKAVKKRL